MIAATKTQTDIRNVLDRFAEYYAAQDIHSLLALFAPDPNVVLYGTGADEKRIGLAEIRTQAERDWSQTEAASFSFDWTSVSSSGPVAWAAADVTINVTAGGQQYAYPARLTAVFEQRGDEWLMVQAHLSFPAPGQDEGESFPT